MTCMCKLSFVNDVFVYITVKLTCILAEVIITNTVCKSLYMKESEYGKMHENAQNHCIH